MIDKCLLDHVLLMHKTGCHTCIDAHFKGSSVKLPPKGGGISHVYLQGEGFCLAEPFSSTDVNKSAMDFSDTLNSKF
jgi:hypothetical protein